MVKNLNLFVGKSYSLGRVIRRENLFVEEKYLSLSLNLVTTIKSPTVITGLGTNPDWSG